MRIMTSSPGRLMPSTEAIFTIPIPKIYYSLRVHTHHIHKKRRARKNYKKQFKGARGSSNEVGVVSCAYANVAVGCTDVHVRHQQVL